MTLILPTAKDARGGKKGLNIMMTRIDKRIFKKQIKVIKIKKEEDV